LKLIALIWGTAFHVIIALTLKLGWFSYVMISTYILFLEPAWIERFVAHLKPLINKPVGVLHSWLSKFDDRINALLSIFRQRLKGRRWLMYRLSHFIQSMGLRQSWQMFSPSHMILPAMWWLKVF